MQSLHTRDAFIASRICVLSGFHLPLLSRSHQCTVSLDMPLWRKEVDFCPKKASRPHNDFISIFVEMLYCTVSFARVISIAVEKPVR